MAERARKSAPAVYICGGDMRPGPRGTDCPNAVHDHPLPSGYGDSFEEADRRLAERSTCPKCPECGYYGWRLSLKSAARLDKEKVARDAD